MTRTDALTEGLDIEAVFQQRLAQIAQDTQALLDRLLGSAPIEGEQARPESAALFGVSRQNSLMAGAALECVHC
jgi:farnesyl diphosphate synthase